MEKMVWEKRISIAERKNDMEKQEQEERKHIEALDRKIERLQEKKSGSSHISLALE